jgi:hypothetical protein
VSLGHVALDGTKVQANASKHKAMSHVRMLKAEKQLEKEINALIRKAEILDAQEDRRYGKDNPGSDLPDELRRRQDRLERIRQARGHPGEFEGRLGQDVALAEACREHRHHHGRGPVGRGHDGSGHRRLSEG